jgi:hypothetical protein
VIFSFSLAPLKAAADEIVTATGHNLIRDELPIISLRRGDSLVKTLKNAFTLLTGRLPVTEQNRLTRPGICVQLFKTCNHPGP